MLRFGIPELHMVGELSFPVSPNPVLYIKATWPPPKRKGKKKREENQERREIRGLAESSQLLAFAFAFGFGSAPPLPSRLAAAPAPAAAATANLPFSPIRPLPRFLRSTRLRAGEVWSIGSLSPHCDRSSRSYGRSICFESSIWFVVFSPLDGPDDAWFGIFLL